MQDDLNMWAEGESRYFLVTADHAVEQYRCYRRRFRVTRDRGGFYAVAEGYGCGKTYRTPAGAITEMLYDHACFNIAAEPAE